MGLKPKKCKCGCGKTFTPTRPMQPTSDDFDCKVRFAEQHAAKAREKRAAEQKRAERAEFKARKEKAKTRRDYMKEAQQAFNQFIRLRDQIAGHACISSGKPLDWSGNGVDAGHYRSVGSAPHLRFDERNCHAQSKQENRWMSGAAVDYRIGLIRRLGLDAVEALEADQEPRKWTAEQLRAIRDNYRARCLALRKELNEMQS